jgi:hypothetical protein
MDVCLIWNASHERTQLETVLVLAFWLKASTHSIPNITLNIQEAW